MQHCMTKATRTERSAALRGRFAKAKGEDRQAERRGKSEESTGSVSAGHRGRKEERREEEADKRMAEGAASSPLFALGVLCLLPLLLLREHDGARRLSGRSGAGERRRHVHTPCIRLPIQPLHRVLSGGGRLHACGHHSNTTREPQVNTPQRQQPHVMRLHAVRHSPLLPRCCVCAARLTVQMNVKVTCACSCPYFPFLYVSVTFPLLLAKIGAGAVCESASAQPESS
jgi:hypothetical protein